MLNIGFMCIYLVAKVLTLFNSLHALVSFPLFELGKGLDNSLCILRVSCFLVKSHPSVHVRQDVAFSLRPTWLKNASFNDI